LTTPLRHSAHHEENTDRRRNKPHATLQFLAAILLPVILVVALQRISIEQPLQAGDQAPELSLKDLSGKPVSLTNPHRQCSAILFFSPDCPHCKTELKNVEQLRAIFSSIEFLLVSRGDRAKTRTLLDSLSVKVTAAIDAEGVAHNAFGVFTGPAWFLMDSYGIVHASLFGERSLDARKEQLESFLRGTAEETRASIRAPQ
jgi:peroxiredoxin